jgi:hypothetical protein
VNLLDLDSAEPFDLARVLLAPFLDRRAQIFVATVVRSRLPTSAWPSDSAPRYIGDESKTRTPASSAAPTTSFALRA